MLLLTILHLRDCIDGCMHIPEEVVLSQPFEKATPVQEVANRVRNWVSNENVRDSGCTFRAFRRDCLRGLILYRGFHRFIPTLLKMRGYRVIEVPVAHRPRRFGRSKYGILNRVVGASLDLLVVRWMKARLFHHEVVEDLGGGLARH